VEQAFGSTQSIRNVSIAQPSSIKQIVLNVQVSDSTSVTQVNARLQGNVKIPSSMTSIQQTVWSAMVQEIVHKVMVMYPLSVVLAPVILTSGLLPIHQFYTWAKLSILL